MLKAKLDAMKAQSAERPEWREAYCSVLERLSAGSVVPNVIPEGAVFPDFVLPDAEGRLVHLRERLERGPVVLSFFRGEWCPYCRAMLDALSEAQPRIDALGASLIAITPDTGALPIETKDAHHARFDILSDVDSGVALAAGIVFFVPNAYHAQLSNARIDLSRRHGNDAGVLPIPATFVLDREGAVGWRFVDPDFTHRAEPDDILAALRRLAPERD